MTPPGSRLRSGLLAPSIAAAALLCTGCQCRADDHAAPSPELCQAQADELSAFLTAMDHEPSLVFVDRDVRLVTRSDLPARAELLPLIQVVASGELRFHGQRAESPADLATALATAARAAAETRAAGLGHTPDPARVHIAVDERAPWSAVAAAAEAAFEAGSSRPTFVFARPPATAPPPPSAVDPQLEAIGDAAPSERATAAARILESVIGDCAAIERLFGTVAGVEDKTAHLLAGIGPALVECDCRVDIPSLRSALWRILGNPRPMSFAAVEIARDGQRLALPADTPWAEAAGHIDAAGQRLWLAVSDAR